MSQKLSDLQFLPEVVPDLRQPPVLLPGSGSRYHHAIAALAQVNHVISFDAHADIRSRDSLDYGNWLRHWLAVSSDRHAVIIGVSEILGGETWLGRDTEFLPLSLLTAGRAEIWPVRARQSFSCEPIPTRVSNSSVAASGGDAHECYLQWRSLDEMQLPRQQKLAVTVDLDCLSERGFAGEWQTGELPPSRLLSLLSRVSRWNTLESVSICGFAAQQSEPERAALVTILRAILRARKNGQ